MFCGLITLKLIQLLGKQGSAGGWQNIILRITLIARMVVIRGSLQGVERIRHTFRWAMDRSTTQRIWLIPLLNRLCQPSRGLPGLLLKGVSHPNPTYPLSAVICQGCIQPNKPVFLIAVMSCVDPGNGFRNIEYFTRLVGEYLQVMPCPMMLSAVQVSSVLPPPTRHERAIEYVQPLRMQIFGLWRWRQHNVKDVQHSINRPGDSGLGCTKNIG